MIWDEWRREGLIFDEAVFSIGFAIRCDDNAFPVEMLFGMPKGAAIGDTKQHELTLSITNPPEEVAAFWDEGNDPLLELKEPFWGGFQTISLHTEFQKKALNLGLSTEELYPLESNTGSDRTLRLARAWIQDCSAHLEACGRTNNEPSGQQLPKTNS
jgi:hypothetical protein